jgi:hypothetical protein
MKKDFGKKKKRQVDVNNYLSGAFFGLPLGRVLRKISNVLSGSWNYINYCRAYIKSGNPPRVIGGSALRMILTIQRAFYLKIEG